MIKAYIDSKALQHNLSVVRSLVGKSAVLAIIKANGYGHGLINVAHALKEADAFGVSSIEEAYMLRQANVKKRIVLMKGMFRAKEELPEIVRYNLEPVIHHIDQLNSLKYFKFPVSIWVKINTGMNRLGFPAEETRQIWQKLKNFSCVSISGMLTHFTQADELSSSKTIEQMSQFFQAVDGLDVSCSLANSAGILRWPDSHANWVRPGLMLYGISPFLGRVGLNEGLKPVMTLSSEIIAIQTPKKSEVIGYGNTFICEHKMRIGIVAAGYGDGYPSTAPYGTPVLVNGKKAWVVGRVCMDMLTIDITHLPDVQIGDSVVLWGPDLPVETVAHAIGTSSYELLTKLLPRVERRL